MAEVPEHLSKESRRPSSRPSCRGRRRRDRDSGCRRAHRRRGAVETGRGSRGRASDAGDAITEDKGGIPAHLSTVAQAQGCTRRRRGEPHRPPPARRALHCSRGTCTDVNRSRGSHPTPADGRQVGFDPTDARRSRRQGARLAAPARARVRIDPVADAFITIYSAMVKGRCSASPT